MQHMIHSAVGAATLQSDDIRDIFNDAHQTCVAFIVLTNFAQGIFRQMPAAITTADCGCGRL